MESKLKTAIDMIETAHFFKIRRNMKKISFVTLITVLSCMAIFSQSHISTQAHQESISMIANASKEGAFEKTYFTAGKDGFLVKWTDDNQGEHFQISDMEIKLIAVAPSGNEIAVYETDGGLVNRVSVWNWNTLSRKFARRFSDTISSLAYSEKGTFLIAGTTTVDGAVFIKAQDGTLDNKIRANTGIISMIRTSETEKTAVMYSPTGSLSYYNLNNGTIKQKLSVEQSLEQPLMFDNYMFLAGVRNNTICIIHGTTGKTVSKITAENPILLCSKSDQNLYYLSNDERGTYTLYVVENSDNKTVSEPKLVKKYKGPRSNAAITCGTKNGNEIILGSKTGAIYRTDSTEERETVILEAITENIYDKIFDIAPIGEDFYFLTRNAVFKSSYDTGMVDRKGENPGQTQLIPYGNKLILWSKGTRNPVQLFDYSIPSLTTLFTPKTSLQSLRLFENTLIDVESNSTVNKFDMEEKKLVEIYTGAGLQDAVIGGDGKLYIAKSYATNPPSNLLCVDMQTKETVPVNLSGNVAFALNAHNKDIYGISVQSSDQAKTTIVFKFNLTSKTTSPILRLKSEDPNAFTYMHYPFLYTNIGGVSVRSCNLAQKKNIVLKRSASIPLKVCQNANRVVILNMDGSISWYKIESPQVDADWYLTRDGQWFEF